MIALIEYQFSRAFRIHLLCFVFSLDCYFPNVLAALGQRFMQGIGVAHCCGLQCHRENRAGIQIHGMLRLMGQMRAAILHLRDLRIRIVRVLPVVVVALLLPLAVQLRQLLAGGSFDAGFFCQSLQKLFLRLPVVTPDDRAQRCIGLQRSSINGHCVALQQTFFGQHAQHPTNTLRCVSTSIRRRVREIVE